MYNKEKNVPKYVKIDNVLLEFDFTFGQKKAKPKMDFAFN